MPTKTVATGICRFDFDDRKVHGFMVRIMRRGTMHQEFFSDKRYGGKRKARQAADDRLAELRRDLPESVEQKGMLTQRNNTGKVGVHLAHDIDKRWPDCEYYSYVASWLDFNLKRINVKFSCKKFGDKMAWELACIARDKELRDREQILKIYQRREVARKAKRKAPRATKKRV